jgi:ABC-type phosphate/phosphonate transport system substrate-binding protein
MIASLMMYARPELRASENRYWAAIREALAARGVDSPVSLSNDLDGMTVWQDPGLVLSQTCGMPFRLFLQGDVTLIGTPDFGVTDCPPGYYRSALVVRADDARTTLAAFRDARFAFNQTHSQSGYAAPYAHVAALGFWFAERVQSHGHRLSAQMVAQGEADIAALDAVTWRLMRQYDDVADRLRVLEWTHPTPGLPYIGGPDADADEMFGAVSEAIASLSAEDRAALGIKGLVRIANEDYLAVPNPPEGA